MELACNIIDIEYESGRLLIVVTIFYWSIALSDYDIKDREELKLVECCGIIEPDSDSSGKY